MDHAWNIPKGYRTQKSNKEMMRTKTTIDVPTGKVEIGGENVILSSAAIGSCVVVSAYSLGKKVGGLAHVMLPGKSLKDDEQEKTKYAEDAIEEILKRMDVGAYGHAPVHDIEICLVGGANVLQRPDDMTGKNNIDSIVELLRGRKLKIKAQSLGGTERRSVTFDVERGSIFYTVADEDEKLLWTAQEEGCGLLGELGKPEEYTKVVVEEKQENKGDGHF